MVEEHKLGDDLAVPPVALDAPEPQRAGDDDASIAEAQSALSQIPLFAGLGADSLETLQALTFRRTFQPGEAIVVQGHTGNGCYVIVSGKVEVVAGPPGSQQLIATLGPGEPFGEMALLGDWKRTASVIPVEDTTCIGIDRWVFLAYLRREPDLAVRMLQFVAQRLVETDRRLTE